MRSRKRTVSSGPSSCHSEPWHHHRALLLNLLRICTTIKRNHPSLFIKGISVLHDNVRSHVAELHALEGVWICHYVFLSPLRQHKGQWICAGSRLESQWCSVSSSSCPGKFFVGGIHADVLVGCLLQCQWGLFLRSLFLQPEKQSMNRFHLNKPHTFNSRAIYFQTSIKLCYE